MLLRDHLEEVQQRLDSSAPRYESACLPSAALSLFIRFGTRQVAGTAQRRPPVARKAWHLRRMFRSKECFD